MLVVVGQVSALLLAILWRQVVTGGAGCPASFSKARSGGWPEVRVKDSSTGRPGGQLSGSWPGARALQRAGCGTSFWPVLSAKGTHVPLHPPRQKTLPGGRREPQLHPGLCGRCWAWHGAGSGGSSTSGQRSPGEDKHLSWEGQANPDSAGHLPCAPPHLQLPHHELLCYVVPARLPEDGGMAQVVLQTPALSLGTKAGSPGAEAKLPGAD